MKTQIASPPLVTAWSYSRYADYDQCPRRFKLKHIDRLPDPGSEAMQRGDDIHKKAEAFTIRKLRVMPVELRHFKDKFHELKKLSPYVEQTWGFRRDWQWIGRPGWFGDDVWLRVKADAAIIYDDNTADVIDHKTGKKYQTNEEQVALMALATWRRFPIVTHVTARLWYLDIADQDENEVILEYPVKDLLLVQRDWDKRVVAMFNDRKFPPKPGQKCGWCVFSKRRGGPCEY